MYGVLIIALPNKDKGALPLTFVPSIKKIISDFISNPSKVQRIKHTSASTGEADSTTGKPSAATIAM
jgi:hypothetical protein